MPICCGLCVDDGCRIADMDALRRYIAKGCKLFFFVGPNAPTFEEIALDIERVAELYKELTSRGTDMSLNVELWPRSRRQDLKAIFCARSHLLAKKLNMEKHEMIVSQDEVHDYTKFFDRLWEESSLDSDVDSNTDGDADSNTDSESASDNSSDM